jgi:AcrR family transcriptional regulator
MTQGSPKYSPSESDRRLVTLCAMGGITQDEIASAIGVSATTLRKYFREELDTAYVKANARVVASALEQAVSGKSPAMTIFWLKARMGWSEKGPKSTGADELPEEDDVLNEVDRRIEELIRNSQEVKLDL